MKAVMTMEGERIRRLERTVGELRERNRQLEAALCPVVSLPAEWRLEHQQIAIFSLLLSREVASLEQLQTAIRDRNGDPASVVQIHSQISKMRKKTAHHNVTITSNRNVGWSLKRRMDWRTKLGLDQAPAGDGS